jgi:hypothetical protein
MLGPRGFLHALSLSPHTGEAIASVSRTIIVPPTAGCNAQGHGSI